ncbi:aminotransferase class V-fold PLP-dependent enzyme [Clostridium sp. SYSU_GA19001]|uniref:aminotransferase class V-fold PLP-dependent enzyme n=1 Tax=Clostridium caldaquaticum TaxID=2940653 RepID=UPI0020777D07|nr:aminotransferase class V-fold PLP-dependent enzyme [Clostridium caldaquaticum]MCM8711940.1 aminotransferase class V-fold PLP-dependent enzyme [Clostridium caldaquaticum]
MKLYLDNVATSYPKPPDVYNAVMHYMINIGANPGRGGHSSSLEGSRIVYRCREALMKLFNFDKLENVVFTSNITVSLNMLIKSVIKDGWHVITTSMEHNSVLRPLSSLEKSKKIQLDILPCSKEGILNIELFKNSIKSNTKLVVLSHASNVIGSIQPIEEIGRLCRENNIYFIIDTAQTAGVIPLDFYKLNLSALAFTGHKSLLGPQGIGGFLISDELNNEALPIIEGGTGSLSESIFQPDFLPDKFESGTMNTPAIAGLLEGINYINKEGIKAIRDKEEYLTNLFIQDILNIDDFVLYGTKNSSLMTPTLSINSAKLNNSELGYILDTEYGIITRTGLHCAPLAHKTIETFPEGTLRISFGPFNDTKDVKYTIHALNNIIKRM